MNAVATILVCQNQTRLEDRPHVLSRLLVVALAVLAVVGIAGRVDAQEPPAFSGELTFEGEPLEGVVITIVAVDGGFSESATTDSAGEWRVEVPPRGATYDVTLDESTLPEGVRLADGQATSIRIDVTRPGQQRRPVFAFGEQGGSGTTKVDQVAQSALNGVKLGLIIALCAVGLSLIFGTTGLINFAHGELVAFGAVIAYVLSTDTFNLWLGWAAVLAAIASGLLGGVAERGLMRPLRRRGLGSFQFVVVTIGLSLVGRQVLQMWIGGQPKSYREYRVQQPWQFGPFDLTPRDLTIMVVSILGLITVGSLLKYTRAGKATRAVADNASLASASGIPVDRVILQVWVAGAAIAGLGGVLLGMSESVQFDMGFRLLLLIFAAVVLGGLGTAYGAMAGGLLIGVVTEVSTVWAQNELKFVWALLALVIALLIRPQGLLGSKERVG